MPILPLFGNKFSPKKGPPRKSASLSNLTLSADEQRTEFGTELGQIKVKLGSNALSFEGGDWISESGGGGNQRETIKIKKQNQQLIEENNLLKVKIEILLDILSERTAEKQLQENVIDELKKMSIKR